MSVTLSLTNARIDRIASRHLDLVDSACSEGWGTELWETHVDAMAAIYALSVVRAALSNCPQGFRSFRSLPEDRQAEIVSSGCDFAILTRDAVKEKMSLDAYALDAVERHAAVAFQSHVDRLLEGDDT